MIITKIEKPKGIKPSFRACVNYVLRHTKDGNHPDVDWCKMHNVLSIETAAYEMYAASTGMRAGGDPVGHWTIGYAADEKPTREQIESDITRILRAIDVDETHQYLAVAHRDTDHYHVHLIVNRYSVDRRKANNDRLDIDKAIKEKSRIEIERGWNVVPAFANRAIRAEIGDTRLVGQRDENAYHDQRRRGTEPFVDEARTSIMAALDRSKSWSEFRSNLSTLGLQYRIVKRGDRIAGIAFGESSGTSPRGSAGSKIDAALSLRNLETRLGQAPERDEDQPPRPGRRDAATAIGEAAELQRQAADREAGEGWRQTAAQGRQGYHDQTEARDDEKARRAANRAAMRQAWQTQREAWKIEDEERRAREIEPLRAAAIEAGRTQAAELRAGRQGRLSAIYSLTRGSPGVRFFLLLFDAVLQSAARRQLDTARRETWSTVNAQARASTEAARANRPKDFYSYVSLRAATDETAADVLQQLDYVRGKQDEIWTAAGLDPAACRADPITTYRRLHQAGGTSTQAGGKAADELAAEIYGRFRRQIDSSGIERDTDITTRFARLEAERADKRRADEEARQLRTGRKSDSRNTVTNGRTSGNEPDHDEDKMQSNAARVINEPEGLTADGTEYRKRAYYLVNQPTPAEMEVAMIERKLQQIAERSAQGRKADDDDAQKHMLAQDGKRALPAVYQAKAKRTTALAELGRYPASAWNAAAAAAKAAGLKSMQAGSMVSEAVSTDFSDRSQGGPTL